MRAWLLSGPMVLLITAGAFYLASVCLFAFSSSQVSNKYSIMLNMTVSDWFCVEHRYFLIHLDPLCYTCLRASSSVGLVHI